MELNYMVKHFLLYLFSHTYFCRTKPCCFRCTSERFFFFNLLAARIYIHNSPEFMCMFNTACFCVLNGNVESQEWLLRRLLPCFRSGVSVATCMAILHVGSTQQVRTGSTSSKEEDYENDAATIVQKCVSRWESVCVCVVFILGK